MNDRVLVQHSDLVSGVRVVGRPMDRGTVFRNYRELAAEAYEPGNRDTFCAGSDTGFVVRDGDKMTVVIAGTNDLQDWFSAGGNLALQPKRFIKSLYVHAGMLQAAQAICVQVIDEILEWVLSSHRHSVTFVGHSRGGAIAQLLPLCVGLQTKAYDVVTFASPRVFTGDGARDVFQNAVHFQNWADIVHRLPLPIPGFRYRFSGTIVYRGMSGEIVDLVADDGGVARWRLRNIAIGLLSSSIFGGIASGLVPSAAVARTALFLAEAHGISGGYGADLWYGQKGVV